MKPFLCLLRAAIALLLLNAATFTAHALTSGDYSYVAITSAAIITGYSGAGGAVTIPAVIAGLPVTSIDTSAFYSKTSLTSLTIPASVINIGGSAFSGCSGLTSVTIGSGVISIGSSAFSNCSKLTSMTIPDSVTSIGSSAFVSCSGLTSVMIGSGVASIGGSAFQSCSGLTSIMVDLLNSTYSSASGVLFDNSQTTLIKYPGGKAGGYTIPASVTSIGSSAFSGCSGLTSVTIPASVTSIDSSAFSGCSGLISVTIPASVTSIGSSAFSGCSGLISVTIPDSVTGIGNYAFFNCSKLTSMTIPDSATSLGYGAFQSCSGLTSVTIGSGVTSLGDLAFAYCYGLTSMTIGSGVTSIGSSAFYNCRGLTSMTIGSGVTSIGSSAFDGCRALTTVTIPASVTSLGDSAFSSCSGLTSVMIGSGVTSIGAGAFFGCNLLSSVYFLGNAPWDGGAIFGSAYSPVRVYYLASNTGWQSAFSGRPTVLWILLAITSQPTSTTINLGGNAIFGVMATGNAVNYQWRKSGVNLAGATSELLFLSNVQPDDAASYQVVVSDETGSVTSNVVTLVVNGPPAITSQPASLTVSQGAGATFSVSATDALGYQWLKNGSHIAGASAAMLALSGVQGADAGSYTVIVGNAVGNTTSNAAVLTVNAPFTQAQYDEVLLAGRNQVIASPNSYGLYPLSQVQALNVAAPLLAKDPVSGKFKLTIAVKKSSDLTNYTALPMAAGGATINGQGELEYQFSSPDNAAFFRLETH